MRVLLVEVAVAVPGAEDDLPVRVGIIILLHAVLGVFLLLRLPAAKASSLLLLLLLLLAPASARAILLFAIYLPLAGSPAKDKTSNKVNKRTEYKSRYRMNCSVAASILLSTWPGGRCVASVIPVRTSCNSTAPRR